MHHITDVVSFISGNMLSIMDPHGTYCSPPGGTGSQFCICDLRHAKDTLASFCPGYKWCPDHDNKDFTFMPYSSDGYFFPGTIMRLPIRTPSQQQQSEIHNEEFSLDDIDQLFQLFKSEVLDSLLFLRYVECISFLEWHEGEDQPRLLYRASVVNPTPPLRSARTAINRSSRSTSLGAHRVLLLGRTLANFLRNANVERSYSLVWMPISLWL